MKHLNLILTLLILICYPLHPAYAFFDKDIQLLTMRDGLADNTIPCIYKDEDGFMWFGTDNGLSRYDGKTIQNFKPAEAYVSVSGIVRLSDDLLGVVSDGFLYYFNRKLETFLPKCVDSAISTGVTHVLVADDSSYWGISGSRLILYQWEIEQGEEEGEYAVRVNIQKEFQLLEEKTELFSSICYREEDKNGIWLTTNRGNLILFHPDTPESYQKISLADGKPLQVTSILNKDGIVWISTIAKGIVRYHTKSGHIDRISFGGTGKENLLSHTDVYQIVFVGNNRYLAVTWGGYTLLMPDEKQPEELTSEIYSNTHTQIYRNLETRMISAYYDPNGLLWIGTNGGGVMYSDLRSQFYDRYYQDRHNEICSILLDDNHRVWLATYHKGIMRSDMPYVQGKKLSFSKVDTGSGKSEETMLCALEDADGNLWFGNIDGTLTVCHIRTGRFVVHSLLVDGVANRASVWALYMDNKNRLYVGTGDGLLLYNHQESTCVKLSAERYLNEKRQPFIRAIVQTKDGTIWLGTSNMGVCRLVESASGDISVENGYEGRMNMEYRSVRSLLASSDGNLYIGYTDGFAVLSPRENSISAHYTTNNGLCSNFIGCMAEDNEGHVWLGSNSGISRYGRRQHLFYNYYIAGSNRSAIFSDKTLFFGNNQSLTYFNPEEINAYPTNERVLITGLEVDNRPVGIGEKVNNQIILNQIISSAERIVLDNDNRDFSLSFNNLSYSDERQKYNYRLLPYQGNWLISDEGERASYTNLPAGDYVFEVRNIYPNGETGEVTSLKIVILPHWSQTFVFRLFVSLLLLGGVAYGMRLIKLRQKRMEHEMQMKHELLTVSLEREKEHQIRVERENFFTGVAHELRTPLTLILAPVQELMKRYSPSEDFYKKLQLIYKNATSLHTLVDQLLYIQKIEAGMVRLQLSETDLVQLVRNVSEPFRQMSEIRQLHFDVDLPDERLLYWVDEGKITSAVQNLLSNAFKYTPPGGHVLLSVSPAMRNGQGYCRITVSDTGAGIPEELQKHIFESFITGDNRPEMSTKAGVGLHIVKTTMDLHHGLVTLKSVPDEGSTFALYIPEGKAHFAKDTYELVDAQQEKIKDEDLEPESFSPASENNVQEAGVKKSLLIIEDNEYIRSLFASRYTVYEAGDGEEGVRVAKEQLPDLIISDVMMPVKDGFTCCREIRRQQETAPIPILMLTAKAEDIDIMQGCNSGADDYMMKPFNPEVLKTKVDNLILQRERLKRIYTKALMLKRKSEEGEKEDAFLQRLISIIEANLSNVDFNVKMLAEQLNMSQPTLYRKVKQRSELSVIDMIRSIRISKAATLILENHYSIQEISEMVGYSDTRTLRKHFMEQFGVSPSKYINSADLYSIG